MWCNRDISLLFNKLFYPIVLYNILFYPMNEILFGY